MTARLRLCEPSEIARLLPRALAGEVVLAPVADDATAQLIDASMPVTEPDAAVIVTTSGSTGTPKQVVLSASAIKASAAAFRKRFGSFSWTCILGPQHVAGLMVHARDLLDRPYDQGRAAISIVPTQLVRALRDRSSAAELASFDAVLVGGAALNPMLLGRARQADHHAGFTRQRRIEAGRDGDQRDGEAAGIGDDALELGRLARPRQRHHHVVRRDHAEVAVIGLGRMDEEGGRARRGERRRDFPPLP